MLVGPFSVQRLRGTPWDQRTSSSAHLGGPSLHNRRWRFPFQFQRGRPGQTPRQETAHRRNHCELSPQGRRAGEIDGHDDMLACCFKLVELWGQTEFTSIINHPMQKVQREKGNGE
jgi:hypothetical protein